MRSANEIQSVTDAVMSVVEQQWPDNELPKTLRGEIRTAIQTSLVNCPNGTISPPELANRWGVSPDKVLNWIRKGDLKAINVASAPTVRPSYRITEDAIEEFSVQRQPVQRTPIPRKRRRRDSDVVEFF